MRWQAIRKGTSKSILPSGRDAHTYGQRKIRRRRKRRMMKRRRRRGRRRRRRRRRRSTVELPGNQKGD